MRILILFVFLIILIKSEEIQSKKEENSKLFKLNIKN